MNEGSAALILFATVALAAVFAFILVLGGPDHTTGNVAAYNQIGTNYITRDAALACSKGTYCRDGLQGIPTGHYDGTRELYECRCQTSDPTFIFWRSPYYMR